MNALLHQRFTKFSTTNFRKFFAELFRKSTVIFPEISGEKNPQEISGNFRTPNPSCRVCRGGCYATALYSIITAEVTEIIICKQPWRRRCYSNSVYQWPSLVKEVLRLSADSSVWRRWDPYTSTVLCPRPLTPSSCSRTAPVNWAPPPVPNALRAVMRRLLYRPKPIYCNRHVSHYSDFSRISPSILNRFTPNLQA